MLLQMMVFLISVLVVIIFCILGGIFTYRLSSNKITQNNNTVTSGDIIGGTKITQISKGNNNQNIVVSGNSNIVIGNQTITGNNNKVTALDLNIASVKVKKDSYPCIYCGTVVRKNKKCRGCGAPFQPLKGGR